MTREAKIQRRQETAHARGTFELLEVQQLLLRMFYVHDTEGAFSWGAYAIFALSLRHLLIFERVLPFLRHGTVIDSEESTAPPSNNLGGEACVWGQQGKA